MTAATDTPKRSGFLGLVLRMIFVWPVVLLWKMASAAEKSLGIFPTLLIGALMVAFGLFLCSSFFGVIFGLPLTVLGAALTVRALY